MADRRIAIAALVLAACSTPPRPPPPPPPPIADAPVEAKDPCAPTVAACLDHAETLADSDLDAALVHVERCAACELAPPLAYRLKASLEAEKGDNDASRDTLRAGVRRFEHNGPLWLALGRRELADGRAREGIRALATAHRLAPEDDNVAQEYRYALSKHGTPDEKVEASVAPLLLEAIGRYELDDEEGAEKTLVVALERAKGSPRIAAKVRHRLALLALQREAPKAAIAQFEAALAGVGEPTSQRAELLLGYAEALVAAGRPADAIVAAKEACKISPANPLAHTNLAVAYLESGDEASALASLEAASKRGLDRRLSRASFLKIGSLARLENDPRFTAWLDRTWPSP